MRVVALAGGVGGAKLADGLAQVLHPDELTIITNTGDDFEHFGLKICPDVDTVCYTLAGLANPETGWGRARESWQALEALDELGGPTWFRLGDRDLGLHLERTRRLRNGEPLSAVTRDFCQKWGVGVTILPMSDDAAPTWVHTEEGELSFQEYFVHRQCDPKVTGFRFEGIDRARPAPGVLEALSAADLVVICPSNPWVSIAPILGVPGIQQGIEARRQQGSHAMVAVSPIIGGQTVKGPAAKMYAELGITPSAYSVARHYGTLLSGFVLDDLDEQQASLIESSGTPALVTQTLMKTAGDRRRLAAEVVAFGSRLVDASIQ